MAKLVGRLRKPEPNKKKIAIIIAVVVVVCLSALGGLYYMFKDKGPAEDEFGRRRFRHDANLPDMHKKSPKEIADYTKSAAYKNLTSQQQMHYMMENGRQMMEYQMDTYFATPKEQRTAYLDQMIDQMQAMRKDMEQMRSQMPDRPRDVNDPNRQARQQARAARMADPSNARSGAERGTALQRAQREQFRSAMEARMKQRGITMPRGPGSGPGGGGPGGR
jgi:hypothetical protein